MVSPEHNGLLMELPQLEILTQRAVVAYKNMHSRFFNKALNFKRVTASEHVSRISLCIFLFELD